MSNLLRDSFSDGFVSVGNSGKQLVHAGQVRHPATNQSTNKCLYVLYDCKGVETAPDT